MCSVTIFLEGVRVGDGRGRGVCLCVLMRILG